MTEYKINQELLQEVLNYLSKRPYAEVFQLISVLQNSEKIENEPARAGSTHKVAKKSKKDV